MPEAAVATVGVLTGPGLATRLTGTGAPPDEAEDDGIPVPEVGEVVDGDVTGCGHEASALPCRAACTPHRVTGTVAPVPVLPGVPTEVVLDPVPVQVPSEVP